MKIQQSLLNLEREKMQNDVIKELYDLYKYALEDASSMWLSEYCCSSQEEEQRNKEDEEALAYMIELLRQIDKDFEPKEN